MVLVIYFVVFRYQAAWNLQLILFLISSSPWCCTFWHFISCHASAVQGEVLATNLPFAIQFIGEALMAEGVLYVYCTLPFRPHLFYLAIF